MHLICAVPTKPKKNINHRSRQCRLGRFARNAGTEYDIGYGTGAPSKGPSQFPLRKYYMTPVSSDRQEWVNAKLKKKCVTLHFFIPNICRNKNFIYLCTRKRKQCNNAEVAQLVEHNLAGLGVAGSSPVFRSSLKRKGCSNGGIGRHEGLKILWPLWLCGFKSRFEYTSLSKHILRK